MSVFNHNHTEFIGKIPVELTTTLVNLVDCFEIFKLKQKSLLTNLELVATVLGYNKKQKLIELRNMVETTEDFWKCFIELLDIFNNYLNRYFYWMIPMEHDMIINAIIKTDKLG
jgi:hypothetical protein